METGDACDESLLAQQEVAIVPGESIGLVDLTIRSILSILMSYSDYFFLFYKFYWVRMQNFNFLFKYQR